MAETEYVLTGDTKQLVQSLDAVTAALREVSEQGKKTEQDTKKIKKSTLDAGKAFNVAGGAALALGAGLVKMTQATMKARNAQLRLSAATGISTSTIAGLEVAMERVGGDSEQVADQLQDFGEKLFDFANGAGEAEEAFQLLGISAKEVRDGTLTVDAALQKVLVGLPKMTNETEKSAAAQQLFSDRGLDFANALDALPLEEATKLARAYGRVVDDEAAASTAKWNRGLADLMASLDSVQISMVNWLNPADRIEEFLIGAVALSTLTTKSFELLSDALEANLQGFRQLIRLDLAGWLDTVNTGLSAADEAWDEGLIQPAIEAAGAFKQARDGLSGLSDTADQFVGPVQESGKAMKDLKDQQDKAKEAAQKHSAKLKEQAKALEELTEIGFEAGLDTVGNIERVLIARDKQLAAIDALTIKAGQSADAIARAEIAKAETIAASERELTAVRLEQVDFQLDALFAAEDAEQAKELETVMAHGEAMERRTAQRQKATDDQKEQANALRDVSLAGIGRISAAWSTLSAARLQNTKTELATVRTAIDAQEKLQGKFGDRRLKELKRREQALKDQARRAWSIQQGLAVAGIAADTARAVLAAFATFAPPPSPVGIASAAAATTAGGIQTAAVLSQKMPTFHIGTDEISATLRLGEAVLTPAAADSLGRDRINDLNRQSAGATQNTGSQVNRDPVSFAAVFRDRVLDTMMTGVLDTGGSFASAIAPTAAFGQVDPFGANG